MKNIGYLIIITFIFCGCATTYQINSPSEAKKRLENKSGTIFLADGIRYEVENIHVQDDTLKFNTIDSSTFSSIALHNIAMVKRTNRARGAGNGALIGGAAVFFPLAMNISANPVYHNPEESGSFFADIILPAVTLAGTGLGALIGAGVGVTDTYVFNHTPEPYQDLPPPADRDPLRVKNTIKAGIEWGGSLTSESNTYRLQPGYSIGFMGGVNLYRASHGAFHLGFEIELLSLNEYYLRKQEYWSGYYRYKIIYDQRDHYLLRVIELLPEYTFTLGEKWVGSVYAGSALTWGDREYRNKIISQTITDSSSYHSDNYTSESIPNPGGYSAGVRVYYKRLMLDLRYRRMSVANLGKYHHLFAEVGFVF